MKLSVIYSSFAITYFKSSGWDSTLTVYALTQERPHELDVLDEISTAVEQQKPSEFHVFQNYPNPFNPTTTIRYQTPISGRVQIVLYSILGQQIRILENGIKSAGMHTTFLDASDLSSGVYIYQVRFEGQVFSRKITLQK